MKISIGTADKGRKGSVQILNRVLSDEYVLYTKTRNYHWNVTGPDFAELHKFFESQYEVLNEIIDEVAERARSVGGVSLGSLREFLTQSRLKESAGGLMPAKKMIASLLADHEAVIRSLREDLVACDEKFGDIGTNDFLTGLMEKHEKMAWMLRSYL